MTRLTNDMRADIVSALMTHKFDDEVSVLCDERAGIALAVYEHHYAGTLERMDKLPKGWLQTEGVVRFRAAGYNHQYNFSGRIFGRPQTLSSFISNKRENVEKRQQAQWVGRTLQTYEATHDIAVRVEKHEAAAAALAERVTQARAQATATLDRFTTVEKLIDAWPEIKPFIPAGKAPPPAVPALPTQHLNQMFDLPVEAE